MNVNKPSQAYLRVGVTGGIGSGKSMVCRLFTKLGRKVFSADEIARELTDDRDDIKAAIRKTFGGSVFLPTGYLNRQILADIVFQNPTSRKKLDAIIHPHVFAALDERIEDTPAVKRKPFVLIEAALIFESGMHERLDYVIVIHADEETRIRRVMDRDKIDRDAVLARIQSQMDPKEKRELADFVIENDGNEEELKGRVEFLDKILCMMKSNG